MKYISRKYDNDGIDKRDEIEVLEGCAWVLVTVGGGNGHMVVPVSAGKTEREGWDELGRVFNSKEEADAALEEIYA